MRSFLEKRGYFGLEKVFAGFKSHTLTPLPLLSEVCKVLMKFIYF